MTSSWIGPRRSLWELMARRAGTRESTSPSLYCPRVSVSGRIDKNRSLLVPRFGSGRNEGWALAWVPKLKYTYGVQVLRC